MAQPVAVYRGCGSYAFVADDRIGAESETQKAGNAVVAEKAPSAAFSSRQNVVMTAA